MNIKYVYAHICSENKGIFLAVFGRNHSKCLIYVLAWQDKFSENGRSCILFSQVSKATTNVLCLCCIYFLQGKYNMLNSFLYLC